MCLHQYKKATVLQIVQGLIWPASVDTSWQTKIHANSRIQKHVENHWVSRLRPPVRPLRFFVQSWNLILFPKLCYPPIMEQRTRKCFFSHSFSFFFSFLALLSGEESLKSMSSFLSAQNNGLRLRESWVRWRRQKGFSHHSCHTGAKPVKGIHVP